MNFRPELAQAVMAGRKTVTRRLTSDNPRSPWFKGACSLKVNQTYAVCPGRGKNAIGRVRIRSVRKERLGWLGPHDAIHEGFPDVWSFQAAWAEINGTYTPGALVWRVEFVVDAILECKGCGHPGDDCICWYIAETEAIEREEAEVHA